MNKSNDKYHKTYRGRIVAINLPKPKELTKKQKEDLARISEASKALTAQLDKFFG